MLVDRESFVPDSHKVVKEHSEERLRELKPSEAMRIGAAIRPQCFTSVFSNRKSCAIGALLEGGGGAYEEGHGHAYTKLKDKYPALNQFTNNLREISRRND